MMLDACAGNRAAQAETRLYNIGDTELTEWLADRLRPYIHNHPFPGSFGDEVRCPPCGSRDLTLQPNRYTAVVIERALYRCDNCGANVSGGWHSRVAATRGVK
jgi:DNA-directed RNA polymerase subunit RPC12/RpoP